jgi:hypothetical protein
VRLFGAEYNERQKIYELGKKIEKTLRLWKKETRCNREEMGKI